ncbi:DNA polymerase IV [Pontiella desulfatans]|uniref:DNA polymerase IV n=1 Tax=Pontiella desulfatans TaxID=2750659 RepID=A0A6C2U2V3_PONDE|nr:DNA polymerase IV [Pontiella desulfatans]VGO14322.1 DNA polymerase IV [Pontiella desulfatans]
MQQEQPIVNASFPQAILHIDGDAFFTSVEQSMHPHLKGRPVVSGKERGIIACASYEAKALGIKRGVGLWEARKICPDLVVLPSDYESYSIYSKRMFEIMRRYTPAVEEYSIDEGFADITGLRRLHHMSYPDIAKKIQETICKELDLTVSVGLSLSKGLCKIASDYRKPHGFTAVRGRHIHLFLQRIPLEEVWGFGRNTVALLQKHGLHTAYDFVLRPSTWAQKMLGKPGLEIWHELRGVNLLPVTPNPKPANVCIGKGKTFTTPSADKEFVYAKLVRNVESAFIKLRRHKQRTKEIHVSLRFKDYNQLGLGARLNRATDSTQEVLPMVRELFEKVFRPGHEYRTTQIWLTRLESAESTQFDLFDDRLKIERFDRLAKTIDEINARFGKHKVCAGTALQIRDTPATARTELPWRKQNLLPGETDRQRLYLPRLNLKI